MKKLQFSVYLNKLFLLAILICLGSTTFAQETNNKEFKINIGDTVVWQPFKSCRGIGYNISGPKVIKFNYLHYGEKIEIIAQKVGKSTIKATCSDNDIEAIANIFVSDPNDAPIVAEKPVKPATQTFTGTYSFNPPTDHFFITINNKETGFNDTYMKLGDNEAFNDGQGTDRFWNIKTGKNWYYRPEAQGWTDDVDWEFEPFGESFAPLNSFANEVNKDDLSQYYVGTEKVLDIDCWKFFVEAEDGSVVQYWVDPANGCTLKRQVNADKPKEVTVYDLNYKKLYFGPSFKKSLHDITR